MASLRSHKNIELMSYSEVTEISGYTGNFKVMIKQKPRYVDSGKCTGCGTCQEKCPVKMESEFDLGLGKRKAIYTLSPQAVPNVPVIDKEHCVYFQKGKCRACEKFCEPKAIDFDQKAKIEEIEVGNIILATGFSSFDPSLMVQYGYGRYENVYTALQFERMSNSSGPTSGKILLKNGQMPKSAAILHCIGSRDVNQHEYCSRVCCMYSLKFSHLLRDKVPDCEIYELYIDLRCFGKGYEEFLTRVQGEKVNLIRGRAGEITDIAEEPREEGKLIVLVEDTLTRRKRRIPVEMVVLSTAMEARPDAGEIARIFSVSLGKDGFFLEKHPKLDPVATTTDGIYVAGCCQGPKDIPDTVAQASAAAGRVLSAINRGRVEIESTTSYINEKLCSGCQTCIEICPYKAISFDESNKVSVINEALCKGCGTCAASCLSGAIISRRFTDEQIAAQIEGALA
jgi:heterodisulfide reductase subunit A2